MRGAKNCRKQLNVVKAKKSLRPPKCKHEWYVTVTHYVLPNGGLSRCTGGHCEKCGSIFMDSSKNKTVNKEQFIVMFTESPSERVTEQSFAEIVKMRTK